MAIQFLRGNTQENNSYTGPVGSLTIDTESNNIRLHDGNTSGGWVIASVDEVGAIVSVSGSSPIIISGTTENPVIEIQQASSQQDGYMSSSDKQKLDSIEEGAEVNAVGSVNGQTGGVNLTASDVGAAETSHTHTISDVTGLQAALSEKAPIENPTFVGKVNIDEGTL